MSNEGKPRVESSLSCGRKIIRKHAKCLPDSPGVYRMLSAQGDVLYVGKAKSLKKRVASYANMNNMPVRLQRMVGLTTHMEFVHTQTEVEALLLESNLIKKLKPRFNILLRDDKSFPHILITNNHDFPLVTKHRGALKKNGQYFGPFASAGDVNRTLATLQRVFMLRNCSDNVFAHRSRPCLQYHIKRCTAPCVDKVSKHEYAAQVEEARDFLEGRSDAVKDRMAKAMQDASDNMEYEVAAQYRDRIQALSAVRAHQDVHTQYIKDADVFALVQIEGVTCIQVSFFRGGGNYGNRSYFPRHALDNDIADILSSFIAQFYENKPIPKEVVTSHQPADKVLLAQALSTRAGRRVKISTPMRAERKKIVGFVLNNAKKALEYRRAHRASEVKMLQDVAALFNLDEMPKRIEVYDNSHISGTHMVGAMIVSGPEGFEKNAYRKFNIKTASAADDYGMMREVLQRRFRSVSKGEDDMSAPDWPDILLIDGGVGQYNAAKAVLEDLAIFDSVLLVAIAKGEDRDAGRETFFVAGREPFQMPIDTPALHYLQRIRDEAHRFAIGAHRKRRQGALSMSSLDGIAGVGAARKKALLNYFGSAKAVSQAAIEDLNRVRGVSKHVAQKIYDYFH